MPERRPGQRRAWQRMLSGRRLDLLDPSPLDVEISDIAHGLARVARWNGQTHGDHPLSVAQHSLVVENVTDNLLGGASPQEKLYALLHDAPEYVIGDMISPFKAVIGETYKDVEARLEAAVNLSFGLAALPPRSLKKTIKEADRFVAYLEATQLAGFSASEARKLFGDPELHGLRQIDIVPMSAPEAQDAFLARCDALRGER